MNLSDIERLTKEYAEWRRDLSEAVLVEIGFGDHPVEGRRLADPAYREKVAQGLLSGILTFLANGAYAR